MDRTIASTPAVCEPVSPHSPTPDSPTPETGAPETGAPEAANPAGVLAEDPDTRERQALVDRIREVAARLGRDRLTRAAFARETGIRIARIERLFPTWSVACERAGLVPLRHRHAIDDAAMLQAMRQVFLDHGGICPASRMERLLPFSIGVVIRRYGTYGAALDAFGAWIAGGARVAGGERMQDGAAGQGPARGGVAGGGMAAFPYLAELNRWRGRPPGAPWPAVGAAAPASGGQGRVWPAGEGGVVGDLIDFRGMMRAPVNEMGVVALFALCAKDLGFEIEALGRAFPDCRARRRVGPGRWQDVLIELEFRARNFLAHEHPPAGCHMIVCWENDWGPACPLEVIELKEEIKKLKR